MIGWHQQLEGHEFEQALGVGGGQGSLVCCCPSGSQNAIPIERLNNNKTGPISLRPITVSEFSSTLPFTIEKFSNPLICGFSCFLRNLVRASHTESLQVSISLFGT